MSERRFDIVLLGATGFTGGLTAEYLARQAPPATRWALAGRNREKLEAVRARAGEIEPRCAELALLEADLDDDRSIRALADSSRVVITTVGPYLLHGEAIVAACAAAGTDYADLTGEPEFVDLMWLRYHEQARRSGARIVHSCGFDSIPFDLGTLYTVSQLPGGVPLAVEGFVRAGGSFSTGTYHSAINSMARLRQSAAVARERGAGEARPEGRTARSAARAPHHDEAAGGWVVALPTIDPQTVLRSARALDRYGPDFTYGQYLIVKRLPALGAMAAGVSAALALAQLAPTRHALLALKRPGEGPSPQQRERGWFRVSFVGDGGGARVHTEVSGGDPGYTETAKMLAESALCLVHDELPDRAGQLTPAVAMGQTLIDRLITAGISFRTIAGQ